jgi:hypothetical protein
MRSYSRATLTAVALLGSVALAAAQAPPAPAKAPSPTPKPMERPGAPTGTPPTPPPTVAGYIVTMKITALAPELKGSSKAAPEAQVLMGALRNVSSLESRVYLTPDLSRQEILSTDFVLPAGTVVLHKAGDKFYVIADPKAKTYHVMDSAQLLSALEGGAGIVNSAYDASVRHTEEKKVIAGLNCRKSIVTVSYASTIPLENDRILVQQKNEIEVWHTSALVSSAAMDHLFFKFQKDKTGVVQKTLAQEIGFPMEVNFVITQAGAGKKTQEAQPGSFHMLVSDVKQEKKLDSGLFFIPPPEFRRLERSPYFAAAAPAGGSRP